MNEASVYAALADIFRAAFRDATIVLRPETTAADVLGWDSLKHVEILIATQIRFGLKLSNKDIDRINCVRDLAEIIERRRAAAPEGA